MSDVSVVIANDIRDVRVGDKVVALGVLSDVGKVDRIAGPGVFVDWEMVRGGESLSEYCAYHCYDLTWDGVRRAWTIPPGHMGY